MVLQESALSHIVCGDGKVDTRGPLHRARCDDGNAVSGDGCSSTCMFE
jgi:cysteine-rich repeat protein